MIKIRECQNINYPLRGAGPCWQADMRQGKSSVAYLCQITLLKIKTLTIFKKRFPWHRYANPQNPSCISALLPGKVSSQAISTSQGPCVNRSNITFRKQNVFSLNTKSVKKRCRKELFCFSVERVITINFIALLLH